MERASTRAWLAEVGDDVEHAEHVAPPPQRHVHKAFHDKLGPAKRWLASQIGRPWSVVYSELCSQFDTRTVAGRHVVHDHMLPWVHLHGPVDQHSRFELYVDAYGMLRKPVLFARAYRKVRKEVEAWVNGRVCALTYRGWWWFRAELAREA